MQVCTAQMTPAYAIYYMAQLYVLDCCNMQDIAVNNQMITGWTVWPDDMGEAVHVQVSGASRSIIPSDWQLSASLGIALIQLTLPTQAGSTAKLT